MYVIKVRISMNIEEELRSLLFHVEKCLKCYDRFQNYSEEDRIRIRDWCHEGPWFFPPSEDGKVKGFFGTGDVVFVCQRPSTRGGRIPNKWDLKFYGLLEEYGFGNAHITDLIKCRGLAGKTSARRIRNCFPYLKKKIEILKPRLIVAVGGMVYRVLSERISELSPWSKNLEKITHYSYAFRYNKAEKLKKELKDLERKMRIRRK